MREYKLADFEVPAPNGHFRHSETGQLTLTSDAQPPLGKFMALRDNDKKFKATWERSRTDIPDRSASGWDMALANIAVEAGWSDQEIADLLIYGRSEHGDDLKLRQDYYGQTIAKARMQHGDIGVFVKDESDPEQARTGRLNFLKEHFGAEITGFTRHPGPPDSYVLRTQSGGMTIKSADLLLSAPKMRSLWLQHTSKVLPPFKGQLWTSIIQALIDICTDDVISDQTEEGRIASWIEGYLDSQPPYETIEAAVSYRNPFYREEQLCIFGDNFHGWLLMHRHEALTSRELGSLLRKHGCELRTISVQIQKKWTTRSVWATPFTRSDRAGTPVEA